jgi:hypothetical protein
MKNTKVQKLKLTAVQVHTNAVFLVEDPSKFKKQYEKFLSKHVTIKNNSVMAMLTDDLDILRNRQADKDALNRVKMISREINNVVNATFKEQYAKGRAEAERGLKIQEVDDSTLGLNDHNE